VRCIPASFRPLRPVPEGEITDCLTPNLGDHYRKGHQGCAATVASVAHWRSGGFCAARGQLARPSPTYPRARARELVRRAASASASPHRPRVQIARWPPPRDDGILTASPTAQDPTPAKTHARPAPALTDHLAHSRDCARRTAHWRPTALRVGGAIACARGDVPAVV